VFTRKGHIPFPLVALIPIALQLGCVTTKDAERVRGELVFTIDRQTLTECGSGRVYLVGTHTSSAFVRLAGRVNEVSRNSSDDATLIADLEGPVGGPPSSAAYPVHGTLEVFVIHSVEVGTCD